MRTYNVVKEPYTDARPQIIGTYTVYAAALRAAGRAWWAMSARGRIWNEIRIEWYDGDVDAVTGVRYPPRDPVLRGDAMYMPTPNFDEIIVKWDDASMTIAGSIEDWAKIVDGANPEYDGWDDGAGNPVSHDNALISYIFKKEAVE